MRRSSSSGFVRLSALAAATLAAGLAAGTPLAADESVSRRLDPISVTDGSLTAPQVLQVPAGRKASAFRYPASALSWRREGTVVVSARIGADGNVESVAIKRSSGFASLDRAALAHVKARRFAPATLRGDAIASQAAIPVTFQLGAKADGEPLAAR